MITKFYARDDDGVVLRAALEYPDQWHQSDAAITKLLQGRYRAFDGQFDYQNSEHHKLLPQVFSGSRLWAAQTDEFVAMATELMQTAPVTISADRQRVAFKINPSAFFLTDDEGRVRFIGGPGQGSGSAAHNLLADFEGMVAGQKGFETALVIMPNGTVVFQKDGGEDYVSFTDDELVQMKDAVLSHNHPVSGGSFSKADVLLAVKGDLNEMRAVGIQNSTRYSYSMRRPKNGWPNSDAVQSVILEMDDEVRNDFMGAINKGTLTVQQANDTHYHEVWGRLTAKYPTWFIYKREQF